MLKLTEEEKKLYVSEYKNKYNGVMKDFLNDHKISKASIYKWIKLYSDEINNDGNGFVNISRLIKNNKAKDIEIKLSEVSITVKNDYDEELLLNIIRTLKKI